MLDLKEEWDDNLPHNEFFSIAFIILSSPWILIRPCMVRIIDLLSIDSR